MTIPRRIPFGDLRVGPLARAKIEAALSRNWISEGENVREFEEKFAAKFRWKHAVATSSGTDAGIVVWSAISELDISGGRSLIRSDEEHDHIRTRYVLTPACAFTSTANCLLASNLIPWFIDIDLETLNISLVNLITKLNAHPSEIFLGDILGFQFVATMGKPTPVREVALLAKVHDLYIVGDWCEAHGAMLDKPADHYADATIYSFFAAHMIVAGEGGMICTDDDEIAALCRSIKCHGYGPGPRFDFARIGYNSKMNELTAAIGLEGLEKFDETFARRREVREKLIDRLSRFEDRLILYREEPGEVIAPHAFPIVMRDPAADVMPLYHHLEENGIQCKTLFGSLPTQHKAFAFLGHALRDFLVAERVGRTGLHFSCSEYLTDDDIDYIAEQVGEGLKKSC